jgi:signal peptidase II
MNGTMNGNRIGLWIIIVAVLGLADRVTKLLAQKMLTSVQVNSLLSFDFMLNRGISWGMFHDSTDTIFTIVSCLIIIVTAILAGIAYRRYQQGKYIAGELLVLCGSVSNIVDRMLYGGVIDFILLNFGQWTFPVFNLADVYIVVGIGIMFVMYARE